MRSLVKKVALSLACLGSIGLVGCGQTESSSVPGTNNSGATENLVQEFVAVTSTSWDAEVTLGKELYTFSMALKTDKTISFKATCTGQKSENSNQGGGGSESNGFAGFDYGHVKKAEGEAPASQQGEAAEPESEPVDLTVYDFSLTGTWEEETGYGYKLSIDNTVIHTDYNKDQGRHQFYWNIVHGENSATVLLQSKDSGYRKKLASDYKTWDDRDSEYVFFCEATGNNSSVATGYMYCHKDKSINLNLPSGSDRSISMNVGTWEVTNNVFSITKNNVTYTADTSLSAARPGYRIVFEDYTWFCSKNTSVNWTDFETSDFDGANVYVFAAENNKGYLNLTDNQNKMYLYIDGALVKTGVWAFAAETFTLTFAGEDPLTIAKENGSYTFTYEQTNNAGSTTESKTTIDFVYTPEE